MGQRKYNQRSIKNNQQRLKYCIKVLQVGAARGPFILRYINNIAALKY
jgi:hypothetical protein